MLSTDLHEAAVEFGRVLRQAPVVAAHRTAAQALEADLVAQGLLSGIREQQASLARMQQAGLTPSQAQIDKLRLCQQAVRGNATIMAYLRTTNEVKAYLPTVAAEISATLGTDYGALAAPSSC